MLLISHVPLFLWQVNMSDVKGAYLNDDDDEGVTFQVK